MTRPGSEGRDLPWTRMPPRPCRPDRRRHQDPPPPGMVLRPPRPPRRRTRGPAPPRPRRIGVRIRTPPAPDGTPECTPDPLARLQSALDRLGEPDLSLIRQHFRDARHEVDLAHERG